MVICLEQGADLHVAQLMPLPLTVSCFCQIQIGFTSLVPAHQGSPRQRAVKWRVCCWGLSFGGREAGCLGPLKSACRRYVVARCVNVHRRFSVY